MDWPTVSLILGILVIIAGSLVKIFGGKKELPPGISPKKFYDLEKKVLESSNKLEYIDEKIEDLGDGTKESNRKMDELTKLLIDFVKST